LKKIIASIPTNPQNVVPIASALPAPETYPVFVVDIGSNNLNSNIFIVTNGHVTATNDHAQLFMKRKETAKLAQGTRKGKRALVEDNITVAEIELQTMRPILDLFPDVRIVATSALRLVKNSQNGRQIIERLEAAVGGRKIVIISGPEEARYMGKAIISEFQKTFSKTSNDTPEPKRMFIGIGGGSIQTGVIENSQIKSVASIPYGIRTLIEESGGHIGKAEKILQKALKHTPHPELDELYATGGNWRDLKKIICARSGHSAESQSSLTLSFQDAQRELTAIAQGDFDSAHIDHREAQEIQYGAMELLTALIYYKAHKLIICDCTMRQAIAEDPDFHSRLNVSDPKREPRLSSPAH
jgi:exopolyphosphatase/pppGpp-phosphohydrolase